MRVGNKRRREQSTRSILISEGIIDCWPDIFGILVTHERFLMTLNRTRRVSSVVFFFGFEVFCALYMEQSSCISIFSLSAAALTIYAHHI